MAACSLSAPHVNNSGFFAPALRERGERVYCLVLLVAIIIYSYRYAYQHHSVIVSCTTNSCVHQVSDFFARGLCWSCSMGGVGESQRGCGLRRFYRSMSCFLLGVLRVGVGVDFSPVRGFGSALLSSI